jgi:diguanylate cyclase (GGDEF)-like protein/PAS domain S-box-containing protein
MSTRMAVITGEKHWQSRYHQFEPELGVLIQQNIQLLAELPALQNTQQTNEANQKLVDMEETAFLLLDQGNKKDAHSLLFSEEYEIQKNLYLTGVNQARTRLEQRINQQIKFKQTSFLVEVFILAIAAISLIFIWTIIIVKIRRFISNNQLLLRETTKSETKYKLLTHDAFDAILIVDSHGIIQESNQSTNSMFDYPADGLIGKPVTDLIPARFHQKHKQGMKNFVETGESSIAHKIIQVQGLRHDGSEIPLEIVINKLNDSDHQITFTATLRDISVQVDKEKKLQHLAHTDSLTNLANRHYFIELAQQELERAKRFDHDLSMLMIDIDLFKQVNDTWGHLAGDEVLKTLAHAMSLLSREIDITCRWGGEEFIILLPETALDGALIFAEKLRQHMEKSSTVYEQQNISVTISVGVAGFSVNDQIGDLIKHADQALYMAKTSGRNQVRNMGDNSSWEAVSE